MYPDDNSVMRVDHFTVGGKKFSKSLIIKDNLRFGLRQRDQTKDEVKQEIQVMTAGEKAPTDLNDPKEGLVSYAQGGDSEFWLHFENGELNTIAGSWLQPVFAVTIEWAQTL